MSSEKVVHGGEVIGRARRDRPGAARLVTVAVAAGVGVLVVAALAFLFHGVKHVRENSAQLKDQILALKDRTLAMEIKQDAAAGDKEEASSHKEEVTALKIHLSSLKTELQQEKADGASLRERLAVFSGNSDQDTEVRHLLDPPVTARYVRFWPQAWDSWISMRVEVLGQDCTGD
uniref:F5/8 type C domain-containing protein n=1 Tax=Branchiostoma floridae TaxID=7739 RepID=C3Y5X8_BRAFL|eukprot:XP_002608365.1 hypothetical protein BRAFLDRAFT_91324 [Branchiostoma floridae]